MDYQRIGQRIQALRKQCGYTQEKLAEAANLSPPYLSHIERGTKKASLESLARLANALDISVDYLLNGTPVSHESHPIPEPQDLFSDCSEQERCILLRTTDAVKQILRETKWIA